MRILITTGGTGGHIYPAIALADIIKEKDQTTTFLFVGSNNRMETTIVPQNGYEFKGISARGFNGASGNKLQSLQMLMSSYSKCKEIIKEFNPDIVIGFGGYVTVGVILAAVRMKIPTVIHEQNSTAGLANKLLGHFAKKVIISYPSSAKDFPKNKTVLLGNPRATIAANLKVRKGYLGDCGLKSKLKTVLMVMGSQGATGVNEIMIETLNSLNPTNYQIAYVTGENNYEDFKSKIVDNENIVILPYVDQVQMLAHVDLVVCRGGATSAAEITALKVPSIIIPSPYVPNNHQYYNAKELLDNGCALLVEEKSFESKSFIAMLEELINDDARLSEMSKNASTLGFNNAAYDIMSLLEEVGTKK